MSKEIVVNVGDAQTRIAIVEDGKLAELYIEDAENKRTIGNLYLGHIRKVMPSIQAAFVDIGQEQDAFLHFSDLADNLDISSQAASERLRRGTQTLVANTLAAPARPSIGSRQH